MICGSKGSKGVREGNEGLFCVFVYSEEMYHSFPVEHALLEGYLCRGMAFSEPDTCFQVFVFSSESYHRFHSFSFISSSTTDGIILLDQSNHDRGVVSCRVVSVYVICMVRVGLKQEKYGMVDATEKTRRHEA